MANKLNIGFVVSELAPLCKTGGLADVAGALPPALAQLGHTVYAFCPLYGEVRRSLEKLNLNTVQVIPQFPLWTGELRHVFAVHRAELHGFQLLLVECDELFGREGLYQVEGRDHPDNLIRFSAFTRASLEAVMLMGLELDAIHSHDWQAALTPVQARHRYRLPGLAGVPQVLTIHNLGYQGLFPPDQFRFTHLPAEAFGVDCIEFYGKLNILKSGIICADAVTTVSSQYSREILTPEFGAGLDGVLRTQQHKLSGIINGIDPEDWNPATDPHLPANYAADNLAGKAACKAQLCRELGLPDKPQRPLIGMITRLAAQKGLDLVIDAAVRLFERGIALVILGTGDPYLHDAFSELATEYPEQLAVALKFDNRLAHMIEAGADMFLMPSRYEPCGLNQLYSMRYGTIPIVNPVGGLRDTVLPHSAENVEAGVARGFWLPELSAEGLLTAVEQALEAYASREIWHSLIRYVMSLDFSWAASARTYEELYRRLAAEGGSA